MKVLIDEQFRKFAFDDKLEKDLQLDIGIFSKEQLNDSKNGDLLQSHLGKKAFVLDASLSDRFQKLEIGPQKITQKDACMITAFTGMKDGMTVVDAGAGSGSMVSFLANAVSPSGHVYSYELRDDFLEIAKKNVSTLGFDKVVTIKKGNVYESIEEKNVDLVNLDLPEPWKAIKSVNKSLKVGGYFVTYLPTITQVMLFVSQLKESKNYYVEQVFEVIKRNWIVHEQVVRPETMMLGHTAFITIARRLF